MAKKTQAEKAAEFAAAAEARLEKLPDPKHYVLGGDEDPAKEPDPEPEPRRLTAKELEDRVAELERELETREKLSKRWRDGDLSDLPDDYPVEVTVHSDPSSGRNLVPVWVNGVRYDFPRAHPVVAPKFVFEVLARAQVNAYQKLVVGDDIQLVKVLKQRYPHSFRLVPEGTPYTVPRSGVGV